MPDTFVAKWKQHGYAYLWRYKSKRHAGWHFTADDQACHALLDLFDRMINAQYSSQQTILVHKPTERILSVPNFQLSWASAENFSIKYPKDRITPEHWSLTAQNTRIDLVLGKAMLDELRKGVSDVLNGKGDYSIGGTKENEYEDSLWFWWMLKN